jgi:hypothetical protein
MEITLTTYQAQIFKMVEDFFSSKGYLGEDLFEDTYVLQKRLAEYIVGNVSLDRTSESDSYVATKVYNRVLGIQYDVNQTQTTATGMDVRTNPNIESRVSPVRGTALVNRSDEQSTPTDARVASRDRLIQGTALVN